MLLNITPDHLDRHGDMAGYIAAKRRIFAGQGATATAIVGIDDPICRGIADELRATAGAGRADLDQRVARPAASMSMPAGCSTPQRAAGAGARFRGSRAPARLAQLAECRRRLRRGARGRGRSRGRGGRNLLVPRPRAQTRACGYNRWRTLYQRFEGHKRGCDGKGAGVLRGDLLDRRRAAESRGYHLVDRVFRARPARLPDRRRGGGVRGDARRCGAIQPLRRSRDRARSGERGRAPGWRPWRGRAAVAGLRLLRPVPEFRSARRRLSRHGPEAARRGRAHDVRAHRPAAGGPVVVDRRPLDVGRAAAADGFWRGHEHGGEPGGRRAARLCTAVFRRAATDGRAGCAGGHVRGVAIAAAHDTARRLYRVRDRFRAARADLSDRRRDQGRAPLDQPARPVGPAVGIRQADLRDRRRLAVRRAEGASRVSRQPDLDRAVPAARRDAGQAARSRHGGGGLGGLVRAVLPGRAAALLGGGRRRRRGRRARRRLFVAAACDQPDQPLPRPRRRRQLPGQPLARSFRQWRAVGPRPGRGPGQGRACPTRMPISSSRWPARNSASSSAC